MSNKQDEINFARVADAIEYITRNYREQPSLFDVAEEVNVSIHHFQRATRSNFRNSPPAPGCFLTSAAHIPSHAVLHARIHALLHQVLLLM